MMYTLGKLVGFCIYFPREIYRIVIALAKFGWQLLRFKRQIGRQRQDRN